MNHSKLADIDLNLLYTFHAFVRCGSLRSTAEELNRSEPAVSARLHQLEQDLSIALFEKVGRRLLLTPAGRILHQDVEILTGTLQDFADKARHLAKKPGGRIRVGCLPTIGSYMLAAPLARFLAAYPQVEVDLSHEFTTPLVQDLREGRIDLLVSLGPLPSQLDVVKLSSIRPVLAVHKRSELAGHDRVTADDIKSQRYLGYRRINDPFFSLVDRYLDKTHMDTRTTVRVASIHTLKELVAANAGVSILPDYTLIEPSIVAVPIAGLRTTIPVWIATRPGAHNSPSLQSLRSLIIGN